MKRLLFTLILFIYITTVSGQDTVSFSFDIQQNGNQLILDSILIENTDLPVDTTLYYPNSELFFELPSNIISFDMDSRFNVSQNYPNPFENETNIKVNLPDSEFLEILVYDNSGRLLNTYNKRHNSGEHLFIFYPGYQQYYILKFSNGTAERSIKLLHTGSSAGDCRIEHRGSSSAKMKTKMFKSSDFSFVYGNNLSFTGYVTACNNVEYKQIQDTPTESENYIFDFADLTELQPEAPEKVDISSTENSITWEWSSSENATEYKYNTKNEFNTATDLELNTLLVQEDLTAGSHYELYVWAYNNCGKSFPLYMNKTTEAVPLTTVENDLILEEDGNTAMTIMNIFLQPDSIILRTPSTNIIPDDENIDHLVDRMYNTVIGTGVGIAAPQVGINRRIIWVKRYDKHFNPWEVYYNPRIVEYSDTVKYSNDGCLSVPTTGEYPEIEGFSYRAIWVDVKYYSPEDEAYITERINHEFTAHIFQHEIDHLDGIMFFDLQELEKRIDNYVIVESGAMPFDSVQGKNGER